MHFQVACIIGTRPETIKMAPVIRALQSNSHYFTVDTICTGQHRELLIPLIEWFGLDISYSMDLMQENQCLNELSGRMLLGFSERFKNKKYDCIVAQGDTTTVFISALAAFHAKIPFVHVEAGLRTFDRNFPFPEEMNRVMASRLASLHFAPTEAAAQNLLREGVDKNSVFVTGNTVVDAVHYTLDQLNQLGLFKQKISDKKIIFVTAHRRENFGEPLAQICHAIRHIASVRDDVSFIFAVHPNPNVQQVAYELLNDVQNVKLVEPMPYQEIIAYLQQSDFILTDSGGLQEEAPVLGKPVLVLRNETERPELVELGGSKLVGTDKDTIVYWVTQLLTDRQCYQQMVLGYSPYGDGKASIKIVDHLISMLMNNK